MKNIILAIIVLWGPLAASPAISLDGPAPKDAAPRAAAAETVAIFPFHNAAGAPAGYLSWYLPELLGRDLAVRGKIVIVDGKEIAAAMLKGGHSPEGLLDRDASLALTRELGASVGVSGRYILEGKSLRLECRAVSAASGKSSRSGEFRGTVDENLLDAAELAAGRAAAWIRLDALADVMARIHSERITPVRDLYVHVRDSRAGIVFRNKWLFSLFILAGFYAVSFLVRMVLERIIVKFTARTKTTLDDEIVLMARRPVRWLIISLGVKLALLPLELPPSVFAFFNNLMTAVVIALVGYFIMKLTDILLGFWGRSVAQRLDSRMSDDLVPLFRRMSRIFIVIITALLVLAKFGIEIGPLIASLGIAGFAIGFAVKDTLSNIIGGIILTLDNSFAVGDKVSVDGDVGVVREVGLRNTQLLTYDNEVIIIPNGELMNKKFKNFALPNPEIRVAVDFGVAYGSDVERVEKVVLEALRGVGDVKEEPAPEVIFVSMGDFSLNFKARFFIPMWGNQLTKKVEATKKIYRALVENGINIPFPTHTVFLENK